jgi:dUTPase
MMAHVMIVDAAGRVRAIVEEVEEVSTTARGSGGFGSTGH